MAKCKFCAHLEYTISTHNHYIETAYKNEHYDIDRCSTKFVAALCEESYFDGEYHGRTTAYFDELKFCPLCATDLRPLLKTVLNEKQIEI